MSAGQKTRVALAKALLNRPDVLLLDEPTASLDPDTADWVRTVIETYRGDVDATILLASHNMAEVERLCDRVVMLKAGRVVADGSTVDLHAPLRPHLARRRVPRCGAGHRGRAQSSLRGRCRVNPADLVTFSPARVGAMVTRYSYLLRSSWPRVLDLLYWPTVQLVTWGFIQRYVGSAAVTGGTTGHLAIGAGTLIGAVMLWDVLFRGQLGFSLSFLEEMHSRNIGNLFMSPLRPLEFVASLIVMSVVRLAIGIVPVTGLAVWFFGFNLWTLGLALAAFFANLMLTSWSVGLIVSGFLLRNGLGAEELAWSFMFLLLPLCCVYYPVGVLPAWLQAVSWLLPPTYVFEGLRAALNDHVFRGDLMVQALVLNTGLFTLSTVLFLWFVRQSRIVGSLLQMGE